ncbi:MAG: hypothetical protein RIS88_2743 [Pseudomonadota bacterium]|jgi:transposase InsO family protein
MTDTPSTPRPGGAAPGGPTPVADTASPAATPARAQHGYPNEVRWHTGQGHQPYANQGAEEAPEPNLGDAFEAGDRGPYSGTNQAQMRQVRRKP